MHGGQVAVRRDGKHRADVPQPTIVRGPVEVAGTVRGQARPGARAVATSEVVQRGQHARGSDREHGAAARRSGTGGLGGAVKSARRPFDQGATRVDALRPAAVEVVHGRQRAVRRDHENRPGIIQAPVLGGAVEVAVAALHQARRRKAPLAPGEHVQRGQNPAGGHRENGPAAAAFVVDHLGPGGRAVEVAVGALDQAAGGIGASVVAEAVQGGLDPARGNDENRAGTFRPAVVRGAVEVAVAAEDQTGLRRGPVTEDAEVAQDREADGGLRADGGGNHGQQHHGQTGKE